MANVEPEEVEHLISSPNQAQGNQMMQNETKFRILEEKVRMTHSLEARIRSSRELLENYQESKESVSHKQREATTSRRETWVEPSPRETRVGSAKRRM